MKDFLKWLVIGPVVGLGLYFLSGKDIDIIAEIIHGVLENEGINTDNDNEDLDGFTFDVIAYYAKEN